MNEQQHKFLKIASQLPARLNVEETAWMLNCQIHDIPLLVEKKLLKPLGNPPRGGQKFFSTLAVQSAMKDQSWLARLTNAIHEGWKEKNQKRRKGANIVVLERQRTLPNLEPN